MLILKKTFLFTIIILILTGCEKNPKPYDGSINQAMQIQGTANPLVNLLGAELALYISKTPAFQYLSDIVIRKHNDHLDSTDAVLSSLQDPFFKFITKEKEVWVYLDVYVGNNTGNLFFEIKNKKVLDLYSNFDDIPNYKMYFKHPTYTDPLKSYREYNDKIEFK